MSPAGCKYTREHEWVRIEGDTARVGITDFAQSELGDVVFVDLPEPGAEIAQGASFGVVESVKAASDLYAPISGTVLEVNEILHDAPEAVNGEPYEKGWMLLITPSNLAELDGLLDAAAYDDYVKGLH